MRRQHQCRDTEKLKLVKVPEQNKWLILEVSLTHLVESRNMFFSRSRIS